MFAANNFTQKHGLIVGRAILIGNSADASRKVDLNGFGYSSDWNHLPFKLKEDCEPDQLAAVLNLCQEAVISDKSLEVSVSRLNSALIKQRIDDKIIDIAICLESLFQAQTEVSFRFALYNSIISTREVSKRREIFALLKKTYDARSKIVHGSDPDALKLTEADIDRVTRVARSALIYKMDYVRRAGGSSTWQKHLDGVVIGIEKPIWELNND